MRLLLDDAKQTVLRWESDSPAMLTADAAALCREVLDHGGLPEGESWSLLRRSFDRNRIADFEDAREAIKEWDDHCCLLDFDLLNSDVSSTVKLGIVTWVAKFLAMKFNLLSGCNPVYEFDEWKVRLCGSLEKTVGLFCKD